MEVVHRQIMTLQKKSPITEKDFTELVELRNQMKNYFHNSRYIFVKDQRLFAEIEAAVNQYGGEIRDYKKTNEQYQKLRKILEELIHQRTGIERFFYFIFIGVWVSIWRWLWRSQSTRKSK
jgi:vacuolar-type H+-ATPase subunit I/STV1